MLSLTRTLLVLIAFNFFFSINSLGWGKEGHEIVAELAFHFLDNNTKQNVKKQLGGMSITEAATWMDDMKNYERYSYMKPWHYVNIEKGETYEATAKANIINALETVMKELANKKSLSEQNCTTDLLILLHLIGDLHQPLHTGYESDKGGNEFEISFKGRRTDLHTLWDDIIIKNEHINMKSCLEIYSSYSKEYAKEINKGNILNWMNESHNYLNAVYSNNGYAITQDYEDKSALIIKKQLLAAGIRLAYLLEKYFGTH